MRSAGLLPYRIRGNLEVLLAHPGGPYFARRDAGWWSVVKGLVEKGESDQEAAAREFEEETGWTAPPRPWLPLGEAVLKSRKVVVAYAAETDFRPEDLAPGMIRIGGRAYPEIDRVAWMEPEMARVKLNQAQGVFIDRLLARLGDDPA